MASQSNDTDFHCAIVMATSGKLLLKEWEVPFDEKHMTYVAQRSMACVDRVPETGLSTDNSGNMVSSDSRLGSPYVPDQTALTTE